MYMLGLNSRKSLDMYCAYGLSKRKAACDDSILWHKSFLKDLKRASRVLS